MEYIDLGKKINLDHSPNTIGTESISSGVNVISNKQEGGWWPFTSSKPKPIKAIDLALNLINDDEYDKEFITKLIDTIIEEDNIEIGKSDESYVLIHRLLKDQRYSDYIVKILPENIDLIDPLKVDENDNNIVHNIVNLVNDGDNNDKKIQEEIINIIFFFLGREDVNIRKLLNSKNKNNETVIVKALYNGRINLISELLNVYHDEIDLMANVGRDNKKLIVLLAGRSELNKYLIESLNDLNDQTLLKLSEDIIISANSGSNKEMVKHVEKLKEEIKEKRRKERRIEEEKRLRKQKEAERQQQILREKRLEEIRKKRELRLREKKQRRNQPQKQRRNQPQRNQQRNQPQPMRRSMRRSNSSPGRSRSRSRSRSSSRSSSRSGRSGRRRSRRTPEESNMFDPVMSDVSDTINMYDKPYEYSGGESPNNIPKDVYNLLKGGNYKNNVLKNDDHEDTLTLLNRIKNEYIQNDKSILTGNNMSGGAKNKMSGKRTMKTFDNKESRMMREAHMRQSTQIHDSTLEQIKNVMNVDENEARILKSAIYQKVKQNKPELSGLDRAIEMKKLATKEYIESLDKKYIEKVRKGIQEYLKNKEKMIKEKKDNEKKEKKDKE